MDRSLGNDVVDKAWSKLHMTQASREALLSSVRIVFVFIFLFIDMSYSFFSRMLSLEHPLLWFIELSIALLLIFQIISNGICLCRYFWWHLFGSAVVITEEQRQLMAIPPTDKSFQTPPKRVERSPNSTPVTFGQSTSSSPNESFIRNFTSPSPNRSYQSPYHTPTGSTPYGTARNLSMNSSFNASLNSSLDRSLNLSTLSQSSGRDGLRSRRSASVPTSSASKKYQQITDVDTLNRFILEEEEREINKSQVSPDNLSSSNTSFWNYGLNPMDFTHALRRFAYQLAPSSLTSPAQSSSSDQSSSLGREGVWAKYGVTEEHLYAWTEKLRKWLSFTIVTRLNAEIEDVNVKLQKIGCEGTQIGKVGVSTLKQVEMSKVQNYVTSLNSIFPYLEASANQEYLVSRIKDLSTGSMSAFSWDKGGHYGKPWSEHLITDAALVMHMFCCYLDSRLPAQPKHPDGKSFTSQHFVKTPDKPDTSRKDNLQIYQSCINPPHFQVVIGSQTYNLPKGRNNMFQAILLFLYHIKVKECGMLGRVNLGMSGLNILWIFD